ncbi:MAG: hypothetical protein J6M93_06795 [Succinivibrio sp.]|nr:hypothetical protein [Succinivibrio sp.]
MQVEVISTGDEVITGMITDTNVSWLCQELLDLGIQCKRRHTVGDKLEDICELLTERSKQADLIFVNGGLGPTSDDNTTRAAAIAAGKELKRIEEWEQRIRLWHQQRGRIMPPSNLKQALIPNTATMIDNSCGTACGFMMKINKALCFFTPGVPHEFKEMFRREIRPYLISHVVNDTNTQVKRLFLFGIAESALQEKMNKQLLPASVILGYRAAYPLLELKLIATNAAEDEVHKSLLNIREVLKNYLICEDTFDLPAAIAELTYNQPFVIYDNVTRGLLGNSLSEKINISCYLAEENEFSQKAFDYLRKEQHEFFLVLKRNVLKGGVDVLFKEEKSGSEYHYRINLNITLKDKTKAAYTLFVEGLIYRILKKLPILCPDNSEIEEI